MDFNCITWNTVRFEERSSYGQDYSSANLDVYESLCSCCFQNETNENSKNQCPGCELPKPSEMSHAIIDHGHDKTDLMYLDNALLVLDKLKPAE